MEVDKVEIRIMKVSDYEKAFTLWSATDGMGLRSLDDSKEGISKFLIRNPNTNFICRIDGQVVGVILCGHDGRRAYIYHAVVSKTYRGRGLGKALLDKVIEAVSNEGIHKIALVVYENNQVGNDFWSGQGFDLRDDLNYRNRSINTQNI
jgi:ribosomal protein S18 acetylase RimI-like enzyme